MDLSGNSEASASDVTVPTIEAPPKKPVLGKAEAAKAKPADPAAKGAAPAASAAAAAAEDGDSRAVRPPVHAVEVDRGRDALLTEFGKETLRDRYLLPGESYQDLFVRVA